MTVAAAINGPSYSQSNEHAQVELQVCKHQAENLLNSLRESIAESLVNILT